MILGRDNEHDNIDFLLAGKNGRGVDAVAVEARRIDKRNVHDAIAEEGLGWCTSIRKVDLEHGL
jgi:hypothetical protein